MLKKNPIALAKSTRYMIGTNIKLTRVAAGHIVQFVNSVGHNFYFAFLYPFYALYFLKSETKLLKIKNPDRNRGAKSS